VEKMSDWEIIVPGSLDKERLKEAAKARSIAKTCGLNDIQAEIIAQLTYLNPRWSYWYGITLIFPIANGIRLYSSKGGVEIDIIYNEALDFYFIKAYKDGQVIKSYNEITWDQLEEIIKDIVIS
jgi:hypothetical protein